MITRLEIRNFQSLRQVDLELGRYTVIVGPSSSGKSAVIRALRAVASNVRGSGTITRGQKSSAVTVRTDDDVVTLERTETSGSYRLVDAAGRETVFTKLGGGVPDQVTKALGIAPVPTGGTSVNFASQFDKPYLLGESGATVARVLGELTKVNVVFEAVRLANKHRQRAASTLKVRREDLSRLQGRLGEFQGLSDKLSRAAVVQQQVDAAARLRDRVDRLSAALVKLRSTEAASARLVQAVPLPDVEPAVQLAERIRLFTALVSRVSATSLSVATYERQVGEHVAAEQQAARELASALRQAGQCPTCGQRVA